MKIAICISGQPRHYEIGYVSFTKAILNRYHPDVFIHTWFDKKRVWESYDRSDPANRRELTENIIYPNIPRGIKKLYKPKAFIHEPQKQFNLDDSKFNLAPHSITPFRLYSQKYSIKKANDLKMEYENKNNFKYDWVIRSRFDLDYDLINLDLNQYNKKYIYSNGVEYKVKIDTNHGMDDCFAVGSSENIDIYSNLYVYLEKYLLKDKLNVASEGLTYHHLLENNIKVHYDTYGITFIGDKDWRLRNPKKDIVEERNIIRKVLL